MFTFDYTDQIRFTKAVYYNFHPIPLPKPFKDGTGGMGSFVVEQGWLELYDQEGACAHLSVGKSFVSGILPQILNGETKSFNEWRKTLYWKARNSGHQAGPAVDVGSLELMMLDLLAQRENKSLHRFMGATKDWAAAYKGGGSLLLSDEELVEDMTRYVEEGYTTVKFKVGSDDGLNMERDLRRIQKVRAAVGDNVEVAVDGNQVWTVEQAYEFAQMAKEYNLAWFEEPIHAHDMNGIKRLKDMGIGIPLAFGESMRISYAYETYIEKGVEHLQPSLGRQTRMSDIFRIRDMAREHGLRFSSGGRYWTVGMFGCCFDGAERIEYHEPPAVRVAEYVDGLPLEKDGKFYYNPDIPGIPYRMNIEKMEKDGLLESRKVFYAK